MPPAKVMIVEDEVITAMATSAMLRRLGHLVLASVPTGEAALKALDRNQPDLILMDIRLDGDLDGIETVQRMREQYDIPVAYVTAYADAETRARARETAPLAFVSKPLDEMDLERILDLLERRDQAPPEVWE